MRRTKSKLTTIQNQSHCLRKLWLLPANIFYPQWHQWGLRTHNTRQSIHRRTSCSIQLGPKFQHTGLGWGGRERDLKSILWSKFWHLRGWEFQSCLSHLETIAVCRGTTSSQMHGAALWSSSWSIAPHVRCSWTTICWAAEAGREAPWYRTAGVVMLKGRCLKVLAQLQPRAEAQA